MSESNLPGRTSPCKDCEIRQLGCHNHCPAYTLFREKLDEVAKARAKERKIREYFVDKHPIARDPARRQL